MEINHLSNTDFKYFTKLDGQNTPKSYLFLDNDAFLVRDRTLSMQERGPVVLVGVMKYFRHILMDREIFFKTFNGPQNIFLRSVFIILFFKLRGWSTKPQPYRSLKKDKICQINYIHLAHIRRIVVKIMKKKKCLMHFDHKTRVFVFSN